MCVHSAVLGVSEALLWKEERLGPLLCMPQLYLVREGEDESYGGACTRQNLACAFVNSDIGIRRFLSFPPFTSLFFSGKQRLTPIFGLQRCSGVLRCTA